MYHLSNVMKHNYKFTSTVIDKLLEDHNNNDTIPFKSDNCFTQYKCKWIFHQYQFIAIQNETKVILYYGDSGHDKGLVDAMSSFGLKGPLRKVLRQPPPPPPPPPDKIPRHLPFLNLVPREISPCSLPCISLTLLMNNARRNRDTGVRFSPIERSTSAAHTRFSY